MLIKDKDRQALLHIFEGISVPVEIWAYGSRVNGTAHRGSDLDLVIRSKNLGPVPAAIYADICERIKESNIPILVELRDWAYLPEAFHANIERQFERLFDNRSSYAA